jgi:hypothetical protein
MEPSSIEHSTTLEIANRADSQTLEYSAASSFVNRGISVEKPSLYLSRPGRGVDRAHSDIPFTSWLTTRKTFWHRVDYSVLLTPYISYIPYFNLDIVYESAALHKVNLLYASKHRVSSVYAVRTAVYHLTFPEDS